MPVEEQIPPADDREFEFLCDCLASQFFPDRLLPDPPADLDWERLYGLLRHHRLAEHFYVLAKSQRDRWPASFREHLRLDRYSLMIYGDQYSSHIRSVLSSLSVAGIPVIVLKGWALIQTIYGGDHSQRFCEDIDILVHPSDTDAAELILRNLNYQGQGEIRPGYSRRYRNARAYYLPLELKIPGGIFQVGLHWGLLYIPCYDPSQIDVDQLFERSSMINISGVSAQGLSLEDHIVYTCAHLSLHHYSDDSLFRYYEIGALVAKTRPAFDWQKVIERACLWNEIIPVRNVLEKVDDLWKRVIPQSVLDELSSRKPGMKERFVNTWIEKTANRPIFEHLLMWLTIPGFVKKISVILEDVFPGPDYMIRGYGQPRGGIWFLLYFRRFKKIFGYLIKQKNTALENRKVSE